MSTKVSDIEKQILEIKNTSHVILEVLTYIRDNLPEYKWEFVQANYHRDFFSFHYRTSDHSMYIDYKNIDDERETTENVVTISTEHNSLKIELLYPFDKEDRSLRIRFVDFLKKERESIDSLLFSLEPDKVLIED